MGLHGNHWSRKVYQMLPVTTCADNGRLQCGNGRYPMWHNLWRIYDEQAREPGMQGLLQNKVAMVTGGGSGIGEATAMTFHRDGAKVAIIDRNLEEAERVKQAIVADGGDAIALHANVAKDKEVATAIAAIVAKYGALHAASNNAAFGGGFKGITEFSEKEWGLINDVTLKGVWLCMKHKLTAMEASGGGAIVNISSFAAVEPDASFPTSAAFRASLAAFTRLFAEEFAESNVRMNNILPGFVDSLPEKKAFRERIPMGRYGTVGEIAGTAAFLLSDEAKYITGQNIRVDGGLTRSL